MGVSSTFRLKRSLACLVKVMMSDFGRPPLFLGGGASGRGDVSGMSSVMARTQFARGNYSALNTASTAAAVSSPKSADANGDPLVATSEIEELLERMDFAGRPSLLLGPARLLRRPI